MVFDGDCQVCQRHARRAISRGILAAPIQERQEALRLRGVPGDGLDSVRWLDGARTFSQSAAVVRILWAMRGRWRVAATLLWLVPKPLRDAGYRRVAARRHDD